MSEERKYIAVSLKHSTKDCYEFWGKRTKNESKRCFSGYTTDIENCELYSLQEFCSKYDNVPVDNDFTSLSDLWKKHKGKCHTVLVDISKWQEITTKSIQRRRIYRKRKNVNVLNKGDKVVMHTCIEAKQHDGTIWICKTDSWDNGGIELVFLEGFSGAFWTEYLQKVNV